MSILQKKNISCWWLLCPNSNLLWKIYILLAKVVFSSKIYYDCFFQSKCTFNFYQKKCTFNSVSRNYILNKTFRLLSDHQVLFCRLGIVLGKIWNEFCYLNLLENLNSERQYFSIKHYKRSDIWIIKFIDIKDVTNHIWIQWSLSQMRLSNIIYFNHRLHKKNTYCH